MSRKRVILEVCAFCIVFFILVGGISGRLYFYWKAGVNAQAGAK